MLVPSPKTYIVVPTTALETSPSGSGIGLPVVQNPRIRPGLIGKQRTAPEWTITLAATETCTSYRSPIWFAGRAGNVPLMRRGVTEVSAAARPLIVTEV